MANTSYFLMVCHVEKIFTTTLCTVKVLARYSTQIKFDLDSSFHEKNLTGTLKVKVPKHVFKNLKLK